MRAACSQYHTWKRISADVGHALRNINLRNIVAGGKPGFANFRNRVPVKRIEYRNFAFGAGISCDGGVSSSFRSLFLPRQQNTNIKLLDGERLFSPNSCWHIKNNKYIMICFWNIDEPMIV